MELPQAYRDMPRWWSGEGRSWLDALPSLVASQLDRWHLQPDGELMHGSHAIAVPVRRGDECLVLRLSPPDQDVTAHVRALRWWDGHGVVRMLEAEPERGAMLLARLGKSLDSVPVDEAMAILGATIRRLAIPAPVDVPATEDLIRERLPELEPEWERLGRPFPRSVLDEAITVAARLVDCRSDDAVNGDLHSGQVLRDGPNAWAVVDPVLMRGDIAYDLGRALWTRIDDMRVVLDHFDIVVSAAELDRDHARDCVVFRTTDYWLWGLGVGLTSDPVRCARLIGALG
jgi:streptomycin 6-kinase